MTAQTRFKVTKPKRTRRPDQPKECHLLALPGELLNKIYKYAVVSPGEIELKANGPGEPALLKACVRTRCEAGGLYYYHNKFIFLIKVTTAAYSSSSTASIVVP